MGKSHAGVQLSAKTLAHRTFFTAQPPPIHDGSLSTAPPHRSPPRDTRIADGSRPSLSNPLG